MRHETIKPFLMSYRIKCCKFANLLVTSLALPVHTYAVGVGLFAYCKLYERLLVCNIHIFEYKKYIYSRVCL